MANATLTKVLLESDVGYDSVELKLADDVGLVYKDLIDGETDAFQDAWMPNHQQYVDEGEGRIEVLKAPWYVGTTRYGIAAPDYMKGVDSISDLDHSGTDMITGIEPGTVLMERIASDVIPRYHLSTNLVEASTPAMLAELKQAYGMHARTHRVSRLVAALDEPGVPFPLPLGPEERDGPRRCPQSIHVVARKGLADDEPAAYTLISAMRLDADQVASLEISINNAANPEAGVRNWLKKRKNGELVRPWVEAAKKAQEEAE
jgi:glycine betaine/proline transport system substrate-binding protein